MPKPLVYPDFAVDDVVDPVSGSNNVIEPSPAKQLTGWDRWETPPRQYMNWIHRVTALWVRWLEEITDDHETRVSDLETVVASATNIQTADTLMMRDSSGRARVNDPSNTMDIVNLGYFEARTLRAGVRAVFYQSAAPSGWTIVSAVNDRVLLAVNNSSIMGGSTGGNWTLSGLSVGSHVLTENEMPSHRHLSGYPLTYGQTILNGAVAYGAIQSSATQYYSSGRVAYSESRGGGAGHDHPLTGTGTWRPSYAAVLICEKATA